MTLVLAILAGGLGALSRYLVSGLVQQSSRSDFPLGTLTVNLTGAFVFGLVTGMDQVSSSATLALVGFLGGFTTFSTWMIETVRLGIPSLRSRGVTNLVLTLVAGVALAAIGHSLTN